VQGCHPLGQLAPVSFEGTKLSTLYLYAAIGLRQQGPSRDLRLMDVQPYNTFVQCYQFHTTSFVATVDKGRAAGGAAEGA
jgi:hypothetical protein